MIIVCTWVEQVQEVDPSYTPRVDLGERYRFKTALKASAVIWLHDGTERDLATAKRYAKENTYSVRTYSAVELDPLGRARREALAEYEAGRAGK